MTATSQGTPEMLIITPVKDSIETTVRTITSIHDAGYSHGYTVFNDFSTGDTKSVLERYRTDFGFELVHLEDLTDTPSPNYDLVLQIAQRKAIELGVPMVIVESDVTVKKDTLKKMLEMSRECDRCGMLAAITVDEHGKINFPYHKFKGKAGGAVSTTRSLSFCCTLLTTAFMKKFSFAELQKDKDWYDVFISRTSTRLGFSNYIVPSLQIMALQCGIVGLPNVGKSTLFNCLSSARAQAANFPFCTIEPNVGVITVPDERLVNLARIDNPKKVVPTTIEIVDIAGLVKGASRGEGLGNKFLANIRNMDAIIHVIRCFDNGNVTHVDGRVDPVRDKEIIDTELQLKDLETVESRIGKIEKQAKTGGDRDARRMYELLLKYKTALEQGKSARTVEPESREDRKFVKDLFLLTDKPVLYVCNVDEASAAAGNAYVDAVREAIAGEKAELMIVAAAAEADIAELGSHGERQAFLEEIGLGESGVSRLIRAAYKLLDLETFFTTGPDETRAWTYTIGTKAPQAAGIIHSDFERGFIRAEVIKYDDYVALGSEKACREAGKIAIEGKDYVVQDGDIMHFLFNV
ncbi:obg gtpase family [Holotrichia oblita]|uniref:Obg gtpase family n=1 Tax=Holotrichia oblita TaxID=644536 RepID=A0ACB9TR71_HOLOL|nr:obg gtpase family [Holotrichia oblita]